MLDVSKPLTSSKVQSYYRSEYSAASNSYYSGGGELRGEWQGKAATELGLAGEVTAEAFDRLAEGQHPLTGEQLIQHRDTIRAANGEEMGHRAGWDLTFNAPKTVSLTALVGEDERVRAAHQHAVSVALDATEKYTQAHMGGNRAPVTTANWIAAKFEHSNARPVDGYAAPHLHTHAVVFNMTEAADGQARSLEPRELYRVQSFATAVYQNQLEHDLRALGYSLQRGANHAPDIKGYSAEYLAAESARTAQIKAAMEEKGLTGRGAESIVKHQVREEKLNLTPEELRAANKKSAEGFGNQPQAVVAEARERHRREVSPEKIEAHAKLAVISAKDGLSERTAVFEHYEVLREALRHTNGRAVLKDVEAELTKEKREGRFIEVHHRRQNAPEFRYTTPELIQTERRILERVLEGKERVTPVATAHYSTIVARYGDKLNEDQRKLVYEALATRDQISGLQGRAGTGKTTALTSVVELAEQAGYKAQGLAPTSRAVKGLQEAGMDATTLQMHAIDRRQSEDTRPRMYFVDESSLVASKQMREFLESIRPQDRVLLIGDTKQHQSIEAGRIFGQLQESGMRTVELNQIVRQKDEGLKQVVEAMAAGRIGDGVDLLTAQSRVQSFPDRRDRLEAIAKAYVAAPEGTLVVSPDNASRKDINTAIRAEMLKQERLKPVGYEITILVNRQNVTGEARTIADNYRVGDSVRYLRGSDVYGLEAKSYATVVKTDAEQNLVTVKTSAGKTVTYDPREVRGVTLYTPETRTFAEGDRIQFTTPWREQSVATRDMGTITHLDKHGNVRVTLDDSGRTIGWNLKNNQHIDYAYAMTSHASQGATVDRVLVHVDTADTRSKALIDETLAYVALSRPRYDAQVFTDNPDQLAKALSRTQENATALASEQTKAYARAAVATASEYGMEI
ncbi:MAG: MobF family relaxase [Bryobacteraceae bacterium]